MKKSLGLALLSGLLMIGSLGGPAHAAGGLVGTTYVGTHCDPPMAITVAGAQAAPGVWSFDVAALNLENTINDPTGFCDFVPALTLAFTGEWDPAVGGCIPVVALSLLIGDMNLCLTDPQADGDSGLATSYKFTVCDHPNMDCETEDRITLVGTWS